MDGGDGGAIARSGDVVSGSAPATADAPHIHVRMVDGAPRMRGLAHHFSGHRIARADGSSDGVFAEWHWDGASLTVSNCRYGLRPLFYFTRPGEIGLSTSIEKLLALGAPSELDYEAIAFLLRLNWLLAEDTPFKAIRIVPPVARFAWNGALQVDSTLPMVRPNGLSRDAALDGFIDTFRRAVERRYVEGAVVPLSGGRDSRHILFELCRIGRPRLCVTVKDAPPWPNPNENTRYARLLTETLGIEHAVVDYIADIVEAERRKNTLTGFCSMEHAWYMPVHDRIGATPGRVFDGIGGDYLAAGGGLDPKSVELLQAGRLDDLTHHLLVRRRIAALSFLADERMFPFEAARARLRRELDRHLSATNPLGSFFFWNRVRRGVGASSFGIMAAHDVCAPFIDHDVFDLLTGLPVEMFVDRSFHTVAIHRAFPQYKQIPFEAKSKTPPSNPRLYLMRNWLKLLWHIARHDGSMVSRSYTLPRLLKYAMLGQAKPVWYDNASVYLLQLKALIAAHASERA